MEIVLAAIWALALVGVFNGMRRLACRKHKRDGLTEFSVSMILAAGLAVASFIQYQNVLDLKVASKIPSASELLDDEIRASLNPHDDVHRAMTFANARHAFQYSGEIREHLTYDGTWIEYCPTEEKIRKRDDLVSLQTYLELVTEDLRIAVVYWVVPVFVAFLLGLLTGRREKGRASGN